MSESEDDIQKQLREVCQIPQVSAELARQLKNSDKIVVSNNRPYYAQHFAEAIKPQIDEIIEKKIPFKLLYADYKSWSSHTIRQRIFDSLKFLADNDNTPSKKYRKWYSLTTKSIIKNQHGKPIGILFSTLSEEEATFKLRPVTKEEISEMNQTGELLSTMNTKAPDWQESLVNFLDDDTKTLKIVGLSLTEDEIVFAEDLLTNADKQITFKVMKSMIVAMKGELKTSEEVEDET